jgi:hypothetical protein
MRLDVASGGGVVVAFMTAAAVILLAFIPAVRSSPATRPIPAGQSC